MRLMLYMLNFRILRIFHVNLQHALNVVVFLVDVISAVQQC